MPTPSNGNTGIRQVKEFVVLDFQVFGIKSLNSHAGGVFGGYLFYVIVADEGMVYGFFAREVIGAVHPAGHGNGTTRYVVEGVALYSDTVGVVFQVDAVAAKMCEFVGAETDITGVFNADGARYFDFALIVVFRVTCRSVIVADDG